jgi:DNA-binding SARP family transcriptional activator/CheY-like chemotaxis protein
MILVVGQMNVFFDPLEHNGQFAGECMQAQSATEALNIAEKEDVRIVVIPQHLQDEDGGLKLLSQFQSKFPHIPAVFVADAPDKQTIISALRFGAKDFLEKPIKTKDLASSITRLLDIYGHAPHTVRPERKSPLYKKFQTLLSMIPNELKNRLIKRASAYRPIRYGNTPDVVAPRAAPRDDCHIQKPPPIPGSVPAPDLDFRFFGKFQVLVHSHPITHWSNRKGRTLLAYLAYNRNRRICKDILMDLFWPKVSPQSARNSLNVAIHSIRSSYSTIDSNHNYLIYSDDCYFLNPKLTIRIDVEEFRKHWKKARLLADREGVAGAISELEKASSIYRGDFMEEDLYEDWTVSERENLREIYLEILENLSRLYSMDGKPEVAIDLCQSILDRDSCREEVHRRLMLCYHRAGKRGRAIKQFHKCSKILKAELEVNPTRETRELYEKIKVDRLNAADKYQL